MGVRSIWRLVPLLGLLIVVVSSRSASVGAFGHAAAATTPKVVGNASCRARPRFTIGGLWASCHTLTGRQGQGDESARALTPRSLTEAKIVTQITNGGYGVIGIAAKKTYPFPMSAFKGKLTKVQIQNIAAFVFTKRTGKGRRSPSDYHRRLAPAPARPRPRPDDAAQPGLGGSAGHDEQRLSDRRDDRDVEEHGQRH